VRHVGTNWVAQAAESAIAQREATPGLPADGPYPATIEEVADELAAFILELDRTSAPGVAACVFEILTPEQ
jgi:hypothetical protein